MQKIRDEFTRSTRRNSKRGDKAETLRRKHVRAAKQGALVVSQGV